MGGSQRPEGLSHPNRERVRLLKFAAELLLRRHRPSRPTLQLSLLMAWVGAAAVIATSSRSFLCDFQADLRLIVTLPTTARPCFFFFAMPLTQQSV